MSWFSTSYTLRAYPRPIKPIDPDYYKCDYRWGQELSKGDCKAAVLTMPWSRENAEVEWAVNFQGRQYTLPMSFNAVPEGAPKGSTSNCVISIEVAGPSAFWDIQTYHEPYTIRASPFQLRGLAAYVISKCVVERGYIGGWATNKIQNLVDYVSGTAYDSTIYPPSSAFLTVTVHDKQHQDPQPGDFDPSVAVFIAEYLASKSQGARNSDRNRLDRITRDFSLRMQRMVAGGSTVPWWKVPVTSASEMTYECDEKLGAPAEVDCAQVEWSQLGTDDETFSLAAGAMKFLSSNTCQVAISTAVAVTISWRQVRIALETLFNVCVAHPIFPATGGRAYYGPQPVISPRDRLTQRQDGTGKDDGITGMDALPQGPQIIVFSQPQPFVNNTIAEMNTCSVQAILAEEDISDCADPNRPPERRLGSNTTISQNLTLPGPISPFSSGH